MPDTEPGKRNSVGTMAWAIRVLLFLAITLLALCAVRWRTLKVRYQTGVQLFQEGKYAEAEEAFRDVAGHRLAAFRLHRLTRNALALCEAEIATEAAFRERTPEAYTLAIRRLEEARAIAGPSEELERRIKEYRGYLEKP